ncbi:MAG: TylF/MycF family methyltransferase [Nitrososphaera sp.]|nr:TylF/MycF family methyltransferase [Nitrososphaera sp.]
MIKQLYHISLELDSPHSQIEIIQFIREILSLPEGLLGVVVEAGSFKGSSTAKFSLACDVVDRELIVFDSFQGIPENDEQHVQNIFGDLASFKQGDYCGTLEEVKSNVAKYGQIRCCRFVPGWFDETLPQFHEPIALAYVDVDLVSSTRTCITSLYPLLSEGGSLYSQDGHLPLVIDLMKDEKFWREGVGIEKPEIVGLGREKLLRIDKKFATQSI